MPLGEGVKDGYSLKRYFAGIGSSTVKIVADRYIHVAYRNKHSSPQPKIAKTLVTIFLVITTSMTLNNLEPPKSGFGEFFAILGCSAHFQSKLRRNG